MTKFSVYLAAGFVLLLGMVFFLLDRNHVLKQEFKREKQNLEQVTAEGARQLNLSRAEYQRMNARWKTQLDSTLKTHEIALKKVEAATIIRTVYKDTGSVKIVYQRVEKADSNMFTIPFRYQDKCWGVAGAISSRDSLSKVDITGRTFQMDASLVITRARVLGFLWYKRQKQYAAYTNCGVIDITQINFAGK